MAQPSLTILAVSVLSMLRERPMHPYEMQHVMRQRKFDEAVKIRAGSLYSTMTRLVRDDHIRVVETVREGRRPERTVYALTAAGEQALLDWLQGAIAEPEPEYPGFGTAVAFLPNLLPADALALLRQRIERLREIVGDADNEATRPPRAMWPRMFRLHEEYLRNLRLAEIAWLEQLVEDIASDALQWPKVIIDWHTRAGRWPAHDDPVNNPGESEQPS